MTTTTKTRGSAERVAQPRRRYADENAIRVVMLHLLKWDHHPSHRSPSIEKAMDEAYEDARDDAMRETDFPETDFPIRSAYDWQTILKRAVEFDDLRSPES